MKLNKSVVGLAVAVVSLSLGSQVPGVFAQDRANEHSPVAVSSVAISEATATATAQGLLAGTVKSSHLSREHGAATWKIRILSTDGLQRGNFRIDANTGAVLKSVIKSVSGGHADKTTKLADKLEKEKVHLAKRTAHKLELEKKHLERRGQKSGK